MDFTRLAVDAGAFINRAVQVNTCFRHVLCISYDHLQVCSQFETFLTSVYRGDSGTGGEDRVGRQLGGSHGQG